MIPVTEQSRPAPATTANPACSDELARRALLAYARSIRSFETRHVRAFIVLGVAVTLFGVVLYDVSNYLDRLEGPRLHQLELESSP
jgi:hypothetical protein